MSFESKLAVISNMFAAPKIASSVDDVVSNFQGMIDDLTRVEGTAEMHINDNKETIKALETQNGVLTKEADRAQNIAAKLRELIS